MRVESDLVEFGTVDDQEYKKIIKDYEEEIFVLKVF
jgi:hypothetical protein